MKTAKKSLETLLRAINGQEAPGVAAQSLKDALIALALAERALEAGMEPKEIVDRFLVLGDSSIGGASGFDPEG